MPLNGNLKLAAGCCSLAPGNAESLMCEGHVPHACLSVNMHCRGPSQLYLTCHYFLFFFFPNNTQFIGEETSQVLRSLSPIPHKLWNTSPSLLWWRARCRQADSQLLQLGHAIINTLLSSLKTWLTQFSSHMLSNATWWVLLLFQLEMGPHWNLGIWFSCSKTEQRISFLASVS